jgi:hypothetical protein
MFVPRLTWNDAHGRAIPGGVEAEQQGLLVRAQLDLREACRRGGTSCRGTGRSRTRPWSRTARPGTRRREVRRVTTSTSRGEADLVGARVQRVVADDRLVPGRAGTRAGSACRSGPPHLRIRGRDQLRRRHRARAAAADHCRVRRPRWRTPGFAVAAAGAAASASASAWSSSGGGSRRRRSAQRRRRAAARVDAISSHAQCAASTSWQRTPGGDPLDVHRARVVARARPAAPAAWRRRATGARRERLRKGSARAGIAARMISRASITGVRGSPGTAGLLRSEASRNHRVSFTPPPRGASRLSSRSEETRMEILDRLKSMVGVGQPTIDPHAK